MPNQSGLLDLNSIEISEITDLFFFAETLQKNFKEKKSLNYKDRYRGLTAALLFFEPSTRTRFSFETAAARCGLHPLVLSGSEGTSLEKGESYEDTILNIQAMGPEVFIIRSSEELDMAAIARRLSRPVINAGWGVLGHPSQALLDAYCWTRYLESAQKKNLQGQRLLIVGDIRHSRVAASHRELAHKLGYEVAFCGPADFLPLVTDVKTFSTLSEGLGWCTAVMVLRVQLERHKTKIPLTEYIHNFQLNADQLKYLNSEAPIFHPGPVNYGTEIDCQILSDSRNQILHQVESGVWLRQALILKTLEGGEL